MSQNTLYRQDGLIKVRGKKSNTCRLIYRCMLYQHLLSNCSEYQNKSTNIHRYRTVTCAKENLFDTARLRGHHTMPSPIFSSIHLRREMTVFIQTQP